METVNVKVKSVNVQTLYGGYVRTGDATIITAVVVNEVTRTVRVGDSEAKCGNIKIGSMVNRETNL